MDELTVFLIIAFVIHSVLLFFDVVFKSCLHYPYFYFLKNTGLQVNVFRIQWFTTVFNRQIQKWGSKKPKLLAAWFTAGTWVTIIFIPVAILLVLITIVSSIRSYITLVKSTMIVEPLVPGWNLPGSDAAYYLASILISSTIHEIGHAIAAVREDVHLRGFTLVCLFVIPVMVTHFDMLDSLPAFKQLKILCAGVWHNIFLALLAAIIATTLPWLLYPFFEFGTGVQVEHIHQGSQIAGDGGLRLSDKITQLNQCPVRGITSWKDCILQCIHEPGIGFCIPDSFFEDHDETETAKHLSESVVECCPPNSPRHLCFEYVGTDDEPLPLPQHSCLLVRSVIDLKHRNCAKSSDCLPSLHCFRPSLDNSTRLVQIHRSHSDYVLFLGKPVEIFHSVVVTDFITVYKYFPSSIPDSVTKLCQFVTLISSGLALLNVIPAFSFDGQLIVRSVIEIFLSKKIPIASAREALSLCITVLGTGMLIIYVLTILLTAS